MDLTGHTGNGAASPDLTNTEANLSRTDAGGQEDIADITILGAGPTGLYGAFYAGMRELKTKIIDALPEPGGQLSALYPEKYIYDAPGYPKIVAKELVKQLYEQAIQWNPTIVLGERVLDLQHRDDGIIALRTDKQTHLTRSVVICAGVGA